MNNEEDISQQSGVETDLSVDKKNASIKHAFEAAMKARQVKIERKRARAESARLLQQKKREKAKEEKIEEEVKTDEKEEEEEVRRHTRSKSKFEDAEQKSRLNEPKAAEHAENPERKEFLIQKRREAIAKKHIQKANRVERMRLAREEKNKFLNRNRNPKFNFRFKKREFPLIRPEKDEEWTLESERMRTKKKQKPKTAKINQIYDYNMEEMVEEVEAEEPDAIDSITQIKTDPEHEPVNIGVKSEPIEMDYSEMGESSSSNRMNLVKIENFEPVRSDITIKQEEINSSDF